MDEKRPRAEFQAEMVFASSDDSKTFAHLLLVGDARVLTVSLAFSTLAALRDQIDALLAEPD
jgi:hypothetical protein